MSAIATVGAAKVASATRADLFKKCMETPSWQRRLSPLTFRGHYPHLKTAGQRVFSVLRRRSGDWSWGTHQRFSGETRRNSLATNPHEKHEQGRRRGNAWSRRARSFFRVSSRQDFFRIPTRWCDRPVVRVPTGIADSPGDKNDWNWRSSGVACRRDRCGNRSRFHARFRLETRPCRISRPPHPAPRS